MEEEKFYDFNILNTDIGTEYGKEFQRVTKNFHIKEGMEKTIKGIGRPTKISTGQLKKVYQLWRIGQVTQKEIANTLNVSERTINRNFKNMESEEDEVYRK